MDPLADAVSLATLPAATPGPVDPGAFAIFQPLHEAVLGGLADVVTNGTATMVGIVHEFFVPMCTLGVIFMAIAEASGASVYMFWLTKYLVRAGVVLTIIDTAADYARWVVTPIQNMGNNVAAQLAGILPGAPGHIYDVLMAHYSGAVVQTIKRMPWSSVLGALESLVLAGMAGISWIISFLAVGVAFAVDSIIDIYLAAVLIVGALFIALAMAGQLRNWLMGWLNSVASLVLSKIYLGVGMAILTKAEDGVLQSILSVADNTNFWSSLGHLFGGMVALCLGAVYAVTVRGMAVGTVGGIYAAMQPYVSAAQNAMTVGMGVASSGTGGSSAGMATPAMAIPRAAP